MLGKRRIESSCVWTAPAGKSAPTAIDKYWLSGFIADFTHCKPGDTVQPLYRIDEKAINQWNQRNLPAPTAGTHWTYMGENYVLIGDADGKIYKAYNGDIFYHR